MSNVTQTPEPTVEVSIGGDTSTSWSQGGEAIRKEDTALGLEFDHKGNVIADAEPEGGTEPDPEKKPEEEGAAGGEEEEAPEADLPDFDPENAEVLQAYEDKLFTFDEEGNSSLNFDGLMAEWDANAGKEGSEGGTLSEATYKALQHFTGISKEAVKEIEAGRVALRAANETALYEAVGGKEKHEAAFKWATEGSGYTQAQKDAFNEAAEKGGTALSEAIELLQVRFEKANGTAAPVSRRPAKPARSATAREAGAGKASSGYATREAYEADAKAKGRDNPEVRSKLASSSFWR